MPLLKHLATSRAIFDGWCGYRGVNKACNCQRMCIHYDDALGYASINWEGLGQHRD
jgi:hypothetical protein